MVARSKFTYGQLDGALRSLGFSCRLDNASPPANVYEHPTSGAVILLPAFPADDCVLDHHLAEVRIMLDGFGVVDAAVFEMKLQKAG